MRKTLNSFMLTCPCTSAAIQQYASSSTCIVFACSEGPGDTQPQYHARIQRGAGGPKQFYVNVTVQQPSNIHLHLLHCICM